MRPLPVLVLALAVAAPGCAGRTERPAGPPPTSATASSGIEGRVTVGPSCPVVVAGSPCPDHPFQGTLRITTAGVGKLVARTTTGEDGRFRVDVPPGDYQVQAVTRGAYPAGAPVAATVTSASYAHVTLRLDSGIR